MTVKLYPRAMEHECSESITTDSRRDPGHHLLPGLFDPQHFFNAVDHKDQVATAFQSEIIVLEKLVVVLPEW